MNILKNMNQYINGRNLRFIALIVIGLFLVWEVGFADTTTWSKDASANTDAGRIISTIINILLRWGAVMLAALSTMVSYFLQPEWVNGELFNLWNILKQLWIMVSNVVYLIFALLLIVIAFMNIVNPQNTNWELKQALPKFIVWVLIVPFSWFFVSLVVSISSVLTFSMLTLPFDSFESNITPIIEQIEDVKKQLQSDNKSDSGKDKEEEKICVNHIIYMWKKEDIDKDKYKKGEKYDGEIYRCKGGEAGKKTFTDIVKGIFDGKDSDSVYGLINIYTYAIMEVDRIEKIEGKKIEVAWGITDLLDLWFDVLFNLIFMLVYIVLMAALFIALFVRWVLLWLYMIFSPVFWLLFFLWDKASHDSFNLKEFIGLAMVPVYVATALSFGFVFLLMASSSEAFKSPTDKSEKIEIWMFSVELEWIPWSWANHMWVSSTLWQVIIKIFGLVILWIGVMAALRQSTITKMVAQPIEQFGTQVWTLVAKSPMYAPVLPFGKDGNQSIASMSQVGKKTLSSLEARPITQAGKFIENSPFLSSLNGNTTKIATEIGRLKGVLDDKELSKEYVEALRSVTMKWDSLSELSSSQDYVNEFNKALNKSKLSEALKKEYTMTKWMWEQEMSKAITWLEGHFEEKYGIWLFGGNQAWNKNPWKDFYNKKLKDSSAWADGKNAWAKQDSDDIAAKHTQIKDNLYREKWESGDKVFNYYVQEWETAEHIKIDVRWIDKAVKATDWSWVTSEIDLDWRKEIKVQLDKLNDNDKHKVLEDMWVSKKAVRDIWIKELNNPTT